MPQHSDGPVWREWYGIRCEVCKRAEGDPMPRPDDDLRTIWFTPARVCGQCDAIICEHCQPDHEAECWKGEERDDDDEHD
jgi:hypothetical protein